ncbi:MAG: GIY-YIG nuclease family protein [bacterium]
MYNKQYYVYIITNKRRTVFYTGVTNNLQRRLFEHKHHLLKGFTDKYNCTILIYFEQTNNIYNALEREKIIKNYSRKKKLDIIKIQNINLEEIIIF